MFLLNLSSGTTGFAKGAAILPSVKIMCSLRL